MRNCCAIAIVSVFFLFLNSCATYSASDADTDEQIDLYISTLDDKNFVWCKLDLDYCRADFESWKTTSRGRTIIKEHEKEKTGQTYSTQHVPNVFRTQYVNDGLFIEQDENTRPEDMKKYPKMFGPDFHRSIELTEGLMQRFD